MIYRLFLYDTNALSRDSINIELINSAINQKSEQKWIDNNVSGYLKQFDVENIKKQIQDMLEDKCQVIVKYPPKQCEQKAYIYVATAFSVIDEVLSALEYIAVKNKLALYDAERNKTYYKELIDDTFITWKQREKVLKATILKNTRALWHYNKIFSVNKENESAFVVTVWRVKGVPFVERVAWFYECLLAALTDGETLECEDRTFKVCGKGYTISFLFEGYKDHANMIGLVENGKSCVELLRRMNTYNAIVWLKQCSDVEKEEIEKRMSFTEMVCKYKNPGDRLVKSVNITKWQRKEKFDIRYSGLGDYDSEIVINVVPEKNLAEPLNISVLKIEEETATFILPFVEDIYPYFYDRYNLTENHLPFAMWQKIMRRIEEAREMIVNDTFNPKLLLYIERFNLYVLADDGFRTQEEEQNLIQSNPAQFLYEHRYEVAHLYDVVVEWSNAQLEYYWGECGDGMMNIQGP